MIENTESVEFAPPPEDQCVTSGRAPSPVKPSVFLYAFLLFLLLGCHPANADWSAATYTIDGTDFTESAAFYLETEEEWSLSNGILTWQYPFSDQPPNSPSSYSPTIKATFTWTGSGNPPSSVLIKQSSYAYARSTPDSWTSSTLAGPAVAADGFGDQATDLNTGSPCVAVEICQGTRYSIAQTSGNTLTVKCSPSVSWAGCMPDVEIQYSASILFPGNLITLDDPSGTADLDDAGYRCYLTGEPIGADVNSAWIDGYTLSSPSATAWTVSGSGIFSNFSGYDGTSNSAQQGSVLTAFPTSGVIGSSVSFYDKLSE